MYRRALLLVLLVCSTGIVIAAVQPASAGALSGTPTPDDTHDGSGAAGDEPGDDATGSHGEDDDGEGDGWFGGWGSGDEHRTEYGADREGSDGEDTADGPDGTDGDGTDDGPNGDGTEDGASNSSDDPEASGGEDGDADRDDGDEPAESDDEHGGTDRRNETHGENGTDERPEAARDVTGGRGDDELTGRLTRGVLDLTSETVGTVTDGVAGGLDGDGDADVELVEVDDGSVRVGTLPAGSSDGADEADGSVEVVEVELDDELLLDDRGRLRAGNVTVGGVLVVPLGPPDILRDDADEGPDDRPALDAPPARDAMAEPTPANPTAAVDVSGSGSSGPDASTGTADETGRSADDADDADGEGEGEGDGAPGSGAGAGAALVVTVGFLGGTRTALDQTALLAAQGPGSTLTAVRHAIGGTIRKLPGSVLPALFGYSRRDGSDPLENETRAEIYDLVRASPGTYHAQLAEETGVAVETVRYHGRILAEEGLVEARKIRGRRRLFPVTMDDDDPELAAAIADSAASDVLSVIERREPTTLSAIAEAVDCAPSTVSYHLDRLEDDGLVTRERDGGAVRVRLRRSTRSALQGRVADD